MTKHFCNIAISAEGAAPMAFIGFGTDAESAELAAKGRIMAAFILLEDDDEPLSDEAIIMAGEEFADKVDAVSMDWQIAEVGEC